MSENIRNLDTEINKLDRNALFVMIAFAVVIILAPFFMNSNWWNEKFSDAGSIGSAIGGLTAPFVGFLIALMTYLSFRAQINANKYQILTIEEEKKKNELNQDLDFIFLRLEEIRNTGNNDLFIESIEKFEHILNGIIDNNSYDRMYFGSKKFSINDLPVNNYVLIFTRQINLYLIILNKLEERRDDLSRAYYDYIVSSLKYEYLKTFEDKPKEFINKIQNIKLNSNLSEINNFLNIIRNNLQEIQNKVFLEI